MILKTGILASLFFFVCGIAAAQNDTTLSLSLEEAQNYALQNNYQAKNARLDIEAAKKKVWETTAIGLPQISATVDYSYNIFEDSGENPFDSLFNPIFAIMGNLHSPQELEEAFQNADLGTSEEEVAFVPDQSLSATVSVNQLIFSGEYIVGLQASKTFLQLSKNQNEKTELDIKETVNVNYFSILSLEKNKEILRENIDILKNNLDESRKMLNQGLIDQTSVDQIEYSYNLLENNYKKLERQQRVSYDLFKIMLGLDVSSKLTLTDNLDVFVDEAVKEALVDSLTFDVENNVDYQILETQVNSNELLLKREKSTYLPSINAYYRYNNDLIDIPVDFTPPHTIGASVMIPIFSSGSRNSKVQQAKIELEKSVNLKNTQAKNIEILALQSKYNFKNAYENFKNEERNFDLAQKIYEDTKIKFNEGMSSSFDLSQSNSQFLDATISYTNSILEFLNAKTQLDKIQNKL